MRDTEAVVTAKNEAKSFAGSTLGQGRKKAGGAAGAKARAEVLDKVLHVASLSTEQMNDWEYFKTEWDNIMVETHGENWGDLFGEIIQNVVNELQAGNQNALSVFVHNETTRVIKPRVKTLQVLGCL